MEGGIEGRGEAEGGIEGRGKVRDEEEEDGERKVTTEDEQMSRNRKLHNLSLQSSS